MRFNPTQLTLSRNSTPFAREPLYKLTEVADKLGTTCQKLAILIKEHDIEPGVKSRGVGRWRLSDFQRAFNAEAGVKKFKVEKAVPITPIQPSPMQETVNKLVSILASMDIGDRVSIEEKTSIAVLTKLRASLPNVKPVSRIDPKDPSTRWVWKAS